MELIASRRVYDGHVVNLRVDTLRTPTGEHSYEVVEHAGAVAVIAVPERGKLLLVRQYRAPLERYTWEVCAGGIDAGEEPQDAARRELREETGYGAGSLRKLWSAYTAPGFCTELLHFFVAEQLTRGSTDFDEGEDIETRAFELDELRALLFDDRIDDAKTQIAVMWALTAH